jgi:hypothetical protein
VCAVGGEQDADPVVGEVPEAVSEAPVLSMTPLMVSVPSLETPVDPADGLVDLVGQLDLCGGVAGR